MVPARTALSVNLNKVALLRNTRPLDLPSVERAGRVALGAGAHGLTLHPRPDARHARPADAPHLAVLVAEHPGAEFNLEGNPFADADTPDAHPDYPGFLALCEAAAEAGGLAQATLVPDAPGQSTSDHGWDLARDAGRLRPAIERLHGLGCRVSLFVDPVPDAMARAADLGADRVELYTEPYARAYEHSEDAGKREFERYVAAAEQAHALGLGLNAGHDLDLHNLGLFATLPHLDEVSIGHALISRALFVGLETVVREYLELLSR
jgi:pyridoxine 5-phosphate synthase